VIRSACEFTSHCCRGKHWSRSTKTCRCGDQKDRILGQLSPQDHEHHGNSRLRGSRLITVNRMSQRRFRASGSAKLPLAAVACRLGTCCSLLHRPQTVPSGLASSSKGNTPSASTTTRRRYGVSFPCAKLDSPTSSLAFSVVIRTTPTGCRSVSARKIPDSLMGFHRAIRVQS
jgi:hypothetical protein